MKEAVMGNLTVRTSNQSPLPVQTENLEKTSAPNAVANENTTGESSNASSKTEVNQQHAAQKKSEQNLSGTVRQNELNAQFASGPKRKRQFPANAGNDQLAKVNIHRQSNESETITRYPNGVKYKKFENHAMYPKDRQNLSSNKVELQKANKWTAIEVEAPPGGKITAQKDGSLSITNANGKIIASLDKDGNLKNHTKLGDYTQNADGKIVFVQKGKADLESLRKPGPIDPSNYEDYGIAAAGNLLRFPNGVEISRRPPDDKLTVPTHFGVYAEKIKENQLPLEVRVPENGNSKTHRTSNGLEFDGWTSNGNTLVSADRDGAYVPTNDGTFIVTKDGEVSFEPLDQ
jgi:hypothetical protein